MPNNALTTEAWRGLCSPGRPQLAYLGCLVVQALAVLIWWPESRLRGVLQAESAPDTLFMALVLLAVSLSYQNIRLGAEELMFTGQQSLREWLLSTRLPLWRILLGYSIGHCLQTLHWIMLSMPIVLVAWSVASGDWPGLGFCLLAVFLLASVFRFAGACVYLLAGHHGQFTYFALRVILITGYLVAGIVFPSISHWQVTENLLSISHAEDLSGAMSAFARIHTLVLLSLMLMLYGIAHHLRLSSQEVARHP